MPKKKKCVLVPVWLFVLCFVLCLALSSAALSFAVYIYLTLSETKGKHTLKVWNKKIVKPVADPGFSIGRCQLQRERSPNLLFGNNFTENCMKMKEFRPGRGGHLSLSPASATGVCVSVSVCVCVCVCVCVYEACFYATLHLIISFNNRSQNLEKTGLFTVN